MRQFFFFLSFLTLCQISFAQKKPLDHDVYDGWQSIGERKISKDGKWIIYAINPQEGDNSLVIQSADNSYKKVVERGYGATISEDNRYVVFRIKPLYKDTREAKIKKKKADDFPKDSLAILELGKEELTKIPRVKSFAMPDKSSGWLAYHLEKKPEEKPKNGTGNKKQVDSLQKVIDSLLVQLKETENRNNRADDVDRLSGLIKKVTGLKDAEGEEKDNDKASAGTDLVLHNFENGSQRIYHDVMEYQFSKNGRGLILETAKLPKDSLSKAMVLYLQPAYGKIDTLVKGGNDFKNFTISEDGSQVAFLAERDSKPKDLQKFYKLWYYKLNMDTAVMLIDKNSLGQQIGMTVSENGQPYFSENGTRLFFGTAPIQAPKDTSLVEIDLVKLDVWHYNDDYLQPMQLSNLSTEQKRNYLAMFDMENERFHQLATPELPIVITSNEGDGKFFAGLSDVGNRVQIQWAGSSLYDIYAIDPSTGEKKMIADDLKARAAVSGAGNYITWYDSKKKHYFSYDGSKVHNITQKIHVPLYDEENDVPNDPSPYGIVRWLKDDKAVLIYDRYDIWQVDPLGVKLPVNLTAGMGRKTKTVYRFINTDREENYIDPEQPMLLSTFNEVSKESGIASLQMGEKNIVSLKIKGKYNLRSVAKAEDSDVFIYTKETYIQSPDLYVNNNWDKEERLSYINPQQGNYNWGTAELFHWKAINGKPASGILYKPENFDPNKKYPVILYFYERHTDNLYQYTPPQPTGSRLNIPFFVSRGYIVMSPDIHYTKGRPAKDAYNYVVSGAQALAKLKWIDAKNMGIQGQSWGGIQVAQLVTMTNMFKAAWSGAPVANMTSAYGGIRWQSGMNRQFQYEKTQSRIGATLWERPDLYIENSPLFHLPKVQTPMVIMHNDDDGAVPWYQGIELFTGLRRLGKKVWLLNYNGEAHNLVQRKNQKDISIREQQFFDYMLKGEKPARWITDGIPAVEKGKDWGLQLVDEQE